MTLVRFINPFATRKFRLRSPLTPVDCAEKLRERTLPWFQFHGVLS